VRGRPVTIPIFLVFLIIASVAMAQTSPSDRPVLNPETGFWEAELSSEYMSHPVKVQVLLPDPMPAAGKRLPVLYILPVEGPAGQGQGPFGDGLVEARKAGNQRGRS